MSQMIGLWRSSKVAYLRTHTRRSEGRASPRRNVWQESELTREHARKLTNNGEARQYVADLLKVGRSTLYRALVSSPE